jgi:hypothetical protein
MALGLLVVGTLWTPSDRVVVCPMRLLFGLPCPTCGLTRSVCATLHGDLHAASGLNLLGPLVVVVAVMVLAAAVAQLAGLPLLDRLTPLGRSAFFVALGLEIVFVWPPHLVAHCPEGVAAALSEGLIPRAILYLLELSHAF